MIKKLVLFVSLFANLSGICAIKDIPLDKNQGQVNNLANLPTGAKDFDVALPSPKTSVILDASEYGISQDTKDFVAQMNQLIRECKKKNVAKLVLPKGTYFITENFPIEFKNLEDFEFDGSGSTLVYCKEKGSNIEIANCKRVKFSNFNIDWDWQKDPLASVVKVFDAKYDGKNSYVDFEFVDYKDFPAKNTRMLTISAYDTKLRCVGYEGGFNAYFNSLSGAKNTKNIEWIKPNIARIHYDESVRYANAEVFKRFKKGQIYRIQHYYYHMVGIVLDSNEEMTMQNVNIWSSAGHAFLIRGAQYKWQFENVNIRRPEFAKNRPITCTADHMHFARSKGFFKMKNCEFSLGADDCINMHDNTGFARKNSEVSILTQNAYVAALYKVGEIIELRQGDYSKSGFSEPLKAIKPINPSKGIFELFFEKKVPVQTSDGFIMFNRNYGTKNILIDNCKFWGNRARGILILASDVTIQNSTFFHHEGGAIKLETGYTFDRWSEGYGVNNIVIRNNTFDSVYANNAGRDIFVGVYMKKDPSNLTTDFPIISNILFEDNTFIDSFGYICKASSVHNITFKNNTFKNPTIRKQNAKNRGVMFFESANGVNILGNTFFKSPQTFYKVQVKEDSVKNLRIHSNKILE